jgi:endonuclease/exonuclease/phosphatase family metal-dependent hydrolase
MENSSAGRTLYPWIKLDLLCGIYSALANPTDQLRILCGDFNTPREEKTTGEIITWGYDYDKEQGIYYLTDPDQDEVERRVLQGLADYNLPDVYRLFHGYENGEAKKVWSWKSYRYDHIFASKALSIQNINYLYKIYEQRLSDHVPIEAVFAPQTVPQEGEIV